MVGARPCEVEGGQLPERILPEMYVPNVGLRANSSLPWHQAPLVVPFRYSTALIPAVALLWVSFPWVAPVPLPPAVVVLEHYVCTAYAEAADENAPQEHDDEEDHAVPVDKIIPSASAAAPAAIGDNDGEERVEDRAAEVRQ